MSNYLARSLNNSEPGTARQQVFEMLENNLEADRNLREDGTLDAKNIYEVLSDAKTVLWSGRIDPQGPKAQA